jgi:hypothetical protein
MRQDILTKATIDRRNGGTVVYKMERGTVGELLFLMSGGSFNNKDIVTAKLRHSGGVDVVIDRVPAYLLSQVCDLRKGRPNFGTGSAAGVLGDEQTAPVVINSGELYPINAFKVPIGHISLEDAKSELEITVDVAKAFGANVTLKIANIEPKSGPDFLLQYDKSNDLESTHKLVREMYIYEKTGKSLFLTDNTTGATIPPALGKDVNVMLYTDTDAYETDIEVLGANTSIDGELDHSVNTLVCAYKDEEALPTPSLRIKISGADSPACALLFIKERMVQNLTSVSTITALDKTLKKTEAIEKMDPEAAKAYRHAGVSHKSKDLATLKDKVVGITPEAN